MNMDSTQIIYGTCCTMFMKRKYTSIHETNDLIFATKPDGRPICVVKKIYEKFTIEDFKKCKIILDENEIDHAVIIYAIDITPTAKDAVKSHEENYYLEVPEKLPGHQYLLELFCEKDLRYDITEHCLQPKFEAVSVNMKNKWVKHPIMLTSDPIARFYGYKSGTVVRCTQKDNSISYRIVKHS